MHTRFLNFQNIFYLPFTCLNRERHFVPCPRENISENKKFPRFIKSKGKIKFSIEFYSSKMKKAQPTETHPKTVPWFLIAKIVHNVNLKLNVQSWQTDIYTTTVVKWYLKCKLP